MDEPLVDTWAQDGIVRLAPCLSGAGVMRLKRAREDNGVSRFFQECCDLSDSIAFLGGGECSPIW